MSDRQPETHPRLAEALHASIEQGRRLADAVRTASPDEVAYRYSTLAAVEETIATTVTYLAPWADFDAHLDAVEIATREHYLPELQWTVPGSWHEADARMADALGTTRPLGGITHTEAVTVCETLGIDPPAEPVSIDQLISGQTGTDSAGMDW